jgi:hypothetical protein
MITHRRATTEDIKHILGDLSAVTRSEIDRSGGTTDKMMELAGELLAAGPSEVSMADDEPLFIVGHCPSTQGFRNTWCFASKAIERRPRETMIAAGQQVQRLMNEYPSFHFVSASFSDHPKRDQFFGAFGFHKVNEDATSAIFILSALNPGGFQ